MNILTPTDPRPLLTPRLLLRQWSDSDLLPFAEMSRDTEVMKFFPKPLEESDAFAMALRCKDLIASRGWGLWVAEERLTGEFLGFIGLHVPSDDLPFSPCVEIGWRLNRAHWGKGLATEGARAALDFGFESLGLDEIVSFTSMVNLRSQAVMERLGMMRDRETFLHPALPAIHPLAEHYLYRIRRRAISRETSVV